MTIMTKFKQIIPILIIATIFSTCTDDVVEPPTLSPFDPNNPETHGDPFNLKVEIRDRKAVLTWQKPDADFDNFIIFRNSSKLVVVPKTETTYTDAMIEVTKKYTYEICAGRANKKSKLCRL